MGRKLSLQKRKEKRKEKKRNTVEEKRKSKKLKAQIAKSLKRKHQQHNVSPDQIQAVERIQWGLIVYLLMFSSSGLGRHQCMKQMLKSLPAYKLQSSGNKRHKCNRMYDSAVHMWLVTVTCEPGGRATLMSKTDRLCLHLLQRTLTRKESSEDACAVSAHPHTP